MKTKVFVLLFFLLIPVHLWATDHYVSNTGAASWSSCVAPAKSGTAACSVATAFANATAGDTVYFRGGTYTVPQHTTGSTYSGTYTFSHTGTGDADAQRIIFKAYPGETPILNGTVGGAGDDWPTHCYTSMIGTVGVSYITIDGFTFQANGGVYMPRIFVGSQDTLSTGINILNNTFNGGSTACVDNDNNEGIRIQMANQTLIKGNRMYNFNADDNYYGVSAIKSYTSTNITIENNEIYNSTTAIYLKSNIDGTITRYNYIHDCSYGLIAYTDGYHNRNGSLYHNIIARTSTKGFDVWQQVEDINNWYVYNNTIYNSSISAEPLMGMHADGNRGTGMRIYNNIFEGAASDYGNVRYGGEAGITATLMDYNGYGASMRVSCAGSAYTTVNNLKAATCAGLTANNHDTHSVAGATVFTNAGGSMALVSDFLLTSASPGYHAGNDGNDMGANVALVGPSAPAGDVTAPTVSITTGNSTISSNTLNVLGTATDDTAVSGCKWRIGAEPSSSAGTACTWNSPNFTCATSGYASGANTLYVECYDAIPNYSTGHSITVTYNPSSVSGIIGGGFSIK